ncbi:hypothetical protein HMSSN139_26570 [Paenibacillus sp. HMSSN-139]|nr:hypothetical protein HMSSN139_26570 [Paenibacillus sp. HMSSN-139]
MKRFDDYELFDKDFEKFVQLGREAFAAEQEGETSAIRGEAETERD